MSETAFRPRADLTVPFSDAEALALHQLRLAEWMATAGRKRVAETDQRSASTESRKLPIQWKLTNRISPHAWQIECIGKWMEKGRGTVKVVTGAGKTLVALFIGERIQNTQDHELRIAIVVPTIVLMHQWYDALLEHGNLPQSAIGRLGGGYAESFGDRRRILIAVLASASEQLPRLVQDAGVGDHLLLVADECHRAGAAEMSKVFRTHRSWSLGLSATPEREDDDDAGYDKSLLGKKLGPVIYEFTLADALREGLVPKFTINHLGLNMTPAERQRYDALSRSITDAMSQLRAQRDSKADSDFFGWARNLASRNQGELSSIAIRFISDTSKRRELLNHMEARHDAVIKLIEAEFANNPDARVILFHESIADVMDLFVSLWRRGFKVIAEHSELPASMREAGLEQFRRGIARIIVSARSLIEGFNVPEADVGIIVASTSSVRQRVQSLGRVLRRHRGPTGDEKTSCIHVLYAADSVEEAIYGKLDWNETTGVDCNKYFRWDLQSDPQLQEGPPRLPLPNDANVDPRTLESGAKYPGQYEGTELSCDSQRNVTNLDGQYAVDAGDLAEAVLRIKPGGGKFRVTPQRHFVLVRIPCGDEWETIYVTQLRKPVRFESPKRKTASADEVASWVTSARLGDPYPFASLRSIDSTLRFKQKSGGVIAKRVRGGEVFARRAERAEDDRKGADAARLLGAIKDLLQAGKRISRIDLNEARHVTYREAGRSYFICALEEGLEFPHIEAVKEAAK